MDQQERNPNPNSLGALEKFRGINNIFEDGGSELDELRTATNVDIDDKGELRAALGLTELQTGVWHSVYGNGTNRLAVKDGDLVRFAVDGTPTVLAATVGAARMAYQTLPDSNTIYMNGTVAGTIIGTTNTVRACGVPIPTTAGTAANTTGSLLPGAYQWQVTYKRNSDGEEGGAAFSTGTVNVTTGGIALSGLPVIAGYTLQVYISSHNDDAAWFAGTATAATKTISVANHTLVTPCKTEFLSPPPVGTQLALYRGRLLVGQGNVLWGSLPYQWELFDQRKDYKMFSSDIGFISPVDDGFYVGTADGVWFVQGDQFDKMTARKVDDHAALANSAATIDGAYIGLGEGRGKGTAMCCVVDGYICAGFSGGEFMRLTDRMFKVPETTCSGASFRNQRGIPQYVVHVA
jgi:hypothetical protein